MWTGRIPERLTPYFLTECGASRISSITPYYVTVESVYPFSFLQIHPLKCKYEYCVHEEDLEGMDTKLEAMHGWLGSMTVCCTPMLRYGRWSMEFHRPSSGDPEINIDQSKNLLEVERGNDLLAALCIAYAFDKALCQPLVTIIGYQEKEHPDDDDSIGDEEPPQRNYPMLMAPPEEDDYDDNEEEFRPAGYLGYEDPEAQEEASEVSGYLEADPYAEDDDDDASEEYDENDEDDPETTGYLEEDGFQDEPGRR